MTTSSESSPSPAQQGPRRRRDRVRPAHALGGSLLSALVVAIGGEVAKGDLAGRVDAHGAELRLLLKEQKTTVDELKITLAEIKAHEAANDKLTDRLSDDVRRAVEGLRDVEKSLERASTRLDDHDRRFQVLEGRK